MSLSVIYGCFLWNFLCRITDFGMNNWSTDDLPFLAPAWGSVNDSADLILLFITFSIFLRILFVNDISLLFSNSFFSGFPLSMLMVSNFSHDFFHNFFSLMGSFVLSFLCFLFSCNFSILISTNPFQDF